MSPMNGFSLTSAQEETLAVIKRHITAHGVSPTVNELRQALRLSSLRSVTQRLDALERKGFIARDRFQHRNITVLESKQKYLSPETLDDLVEIPVIASAGCDAMDVYAQDEFGEFIAVDRKIIGRRTQVAAIRAVGDSMEDAGIRDGDHVIVEVTDDVDNGDRVVAIIGNMAVIKQFSRVDEDLVILHPRNKGAGYAPIIVKEEDSKIFGKVLSIIPNTDWVEDIKIEYYEGYGPR
jgi:repressor LexA